MELRVEAEDAAAEHAVEQLVPPRADRERLGVRPRNVPERDDRRARQQVADHARQQREMVVLHEDDRVRGLRFLLDRVRELRVHVAIVLEVRRAERRPHMRDVAERPQALVREAAVVAGLLLGRQPDAAQLVGGRVRRHGDAVEFVDGDAVRGAAAMCDPDPGACAHHGLERSDEAARGPLDADAVRRLHVDVRLAVADHDDLVAPQLAFQDRAQRFGRPRELRLVPRAVLALRAGARARVRRARAGAAPARRRRSRDARVPRHAAAPAIPAPSRATRAGR